MKKIIILLILLLCTCIITLIFLMNINTEYEEEEINGADQTEYTNELQKVTSYRNYNMVSNCINKYLKNIYYAKNSDEITNQDIVETPEELQESVYHMLYKPYIIQNEINKDNILDKVYDLNQINIINVLDIRMISDERIQTYYVYGEIAESRVYLIVYIDDYNATFAIQPLGEKYNSIDEIIVRCEEKEIIENYDNGVLYNQINDQMVSTYYLMNYKTKLKNNIEQAYNLLDETYKQKRFGNIENFKEYIDDSEKIIDKITLKSYQTNTFDDYIEYICKDVYENYYIFHVYSVLEYNVKLDIYTISDTFMTAYEKESEPKKVALNIEKFIQMINARDYKNAYKVLDQTFKKEKFDSYEKFKKYIKNVFFSDNHIKYSNYQQSGDLHIYDITITNKEKNQSINKTFVMKLLDGTDFVMSFSV